MAKKKRTMMSSPPLPPLPAWTAAVGQVGQDTIVIVTDDRDFDKRIRLALRDRAYKLLTVDDFAAHEGELIATCLGIVDARADDGSAVLRYIRESFYGSDYPLIGIESKRQYRDMMTCCFCPMFDFQLTDPFNPTEIPLFVERLIRVSREEPDEAWRI